jgi:hypothetical protein
VTASVVQQFSNHNNGSTSLTASFTGTGSALTAGNAVVVCIGAVADPAVSGVTLSDGSALTQRAAQVGDDFGTVSLYVYDIFGVSGGETSLTVTLGSSNANNQLNVQTYEVSGLSGTVDTSSHTNGSSTTYTSGAVSTGHATDAWFGVAQSFGSNVTVSAPSSGWTSQSTITNSAGGFYTRMVSGYQVVSATGSMNYAGAISPGSPYDAVAVAYESTSAIVSGAGASTLSVASTGTGGVRGFAYATGALALRTSCQPIVVQKLIVSVASEAGVRPSGAAYPAGFALFGVGGLFGYTGVMESAGLTLSVAMNAGQDAAGNAYPEGAMLPQAMLVNQTGDPATPSGGGYLYAKAGALYWIGSSGTVTKVANA